MATTVVQVVTNPSESPAKVYLAKMESNQEDPNVGGYALVDIGSGNGLYTFDVVESLVGIYQIRAEDISAETTGFGYVYIHADDTNTYHSSIDIGGAEAARSRYEIADLDAKIDTLTATVSALAGAVAALNDPSATEVAEETLSYNVANLESSLTAANINSLVEMIMLALNGDRSDGLNAIARKFGDNSSFNSRSITTNPNAEPVVEID